MESESTLLLKNAWGVEFFVSKVFKLAAIRLILVMDNHYYLLSQSVNLLQKKTNVLRVERLASRGLAFVAKQDKLVMAENTCLCIIMAPVQPRPQHALQVDRLVIHQHGEKLLT